MKKSNVAKRVRYFNNNNKKKHLIGRLLYKCVDASFSILKAPLLMLMIFIACREDRALKQSIFQMCLAASVCVFGLPTMPAYLMQCTDKATNSL